MDTQEQGTPEEWAARYTRSVAAEIRRHRKARGWSAQKLADQCQALGLPIPRYTISDLENGRRTALGVAELAVIGYALGVPPLLLMYPAGYEEETEVLPGVTRPPFRCARWFAGETPFPGDDDEDYLASISTDWLDASGSPLGLYRANERVLLEEAETLRRAGQMELQVAVTNGPEPSPFATAAAALRQAAESYRAAREGLRRKAEQLGLLPPRDA